MNYLLGRDGGLQRAHLVCLVVPLQEGLTHAVLEVKIGGRRVVVLLHQLVVQFLVVGLYVLDAVGLLNLAPTK